MSYEITTLETLQQSLLDFYKTQLPLVPSQGWRRRWDKRKSFVLVPSEPTVTCLYRLLTGAKESPLCLHSVSAPPQHIQEVLPPGAASERDASEHKAGRGPGDSYEVPICFLSYPLDRRNHYTSQECRFPRSSNYQGFWRNGPETNEASTQMPSESKTRPVLSCCPPASWFIQFLPCTSPVSVNLPQAVGGVG